jgi:superfamily I DNA/RNA helicase
MSLKPKVALSQDFLLNLSRLPNSIQTKVMRWAVKFQSDPTSTGINYEKIHAAADPGMRSVRIEGDWRGIVFKPGQGDIYVLLHVNKHDEAYRWAERRKLVINPVTGAMQMVFLAESVIGVEPSEVSGFEPSIDEQEYDHGPNSTPITNGATDQELIALGVPLEMLGRVKSLTSEAELDSLQQILPVEAYEGLFLMVAGETANQILMDRETRVDRKVDTSDYSSAIDTPESRSRFVVVDDEALIAIMNAPLAQWRVFLHPSQQKLAIGRRSGPVRVLGGAGTGKTVVAMHRAKWLAENTLLEGERLLFTTFTRNLAIDIEENLKALCSATTLSKIEVKNLDAWVHSFLRSRKLEHRIVYDRSEDGAKQAWQLALAGRDESLDLTETFYEEELERVVLAQGVRSRDEYRVVRRTGRGVLLSRSKRDAIWPVFEEYRAQLALRKLKEVDDAYADVADLILKEREEGATSSLKYGSVIIDETQDFGPQALRLIRAIIEPSQNDLFFVGDGHQRIYSRNKAAMSKCGIDIRGRSKKLYLNYRTTDEIRRQAVAFLEGCSVDDLDEGSDETIRYKSLSHGPSPEIIKNESLDEILAPLLNTLNGWREQAESDVPDTCCVIASSKKHRDAIGSFLQRSGLETHVIDENRNAGVPSGKVYIATMHRAKGLEFDRVAVIAPKGYLGQLPASENHRKLLYVAVSRAKRESTIFLS